MSGHSLSVVFGHSCDDVKLPQDCEAVGTPVTQLKDAPQVTNPLFKVLAMHITIRGTKEMWFK